MPWRSRALVCEVRQSAKKLRWVAVCDFLPGTLKNGAVFIRLNI